MGGLRNMLSLLCELVSMIHANWTVAASSDSMMVTVDLTDLAMFFITIKEEALLASCIGDGELRALGNTLWFMMGSRTWNKARDATGSNQEISVDLGIKSILKHQRTLESRIEE